ncbi:MAG: hypothetical protein K1X79_04780 [Oligoflexia bacterium]|nr:hypothetical protein [Oligoflexia bacterium]
MRLSVTNMNKLIAGVFVAGSLFGCGSATNNDQGVTFNFLGFFESSGTGTGDLPTALGSISFPLSDPDAEDVSEGNSSGAGSVNAVIATENFLGCQGLRADRVYLSYTVPGALENPPSTTVVVSALMGPSSGGAEAAAACTSSLPAGYLNLSSRAFATIAVVPASIRQWMILNKASLPEPPFNMIVSATIGGVSTAGDRFESNEGELTAQVTPDIVISPSTGGSSSSGSGA